MVSINIIAVLMGLILLLLLILKVRIPAFIALLIASIVVGLITGMPGESIFKTIEKGMGSTLGYVATIVGLGSLFGALLENARGAEAIANYLLRIFGQKNSSWALMLTGFVVAIPVFFDVAFVILVPVIYAIQRKTKKSLLFFAIPLLAGLAITHTFIPPTPGPVAVADIIKADLGWVILLGFVVSVPTAVICGPIWAKYIGKRIEISAPESLGIQESKNSGELPSIGMIISIIFIPIVLIVIRTLMASMASKDLQGSFLGTFINLIGHPFAALIIANLIAWYALGIKRNYDSDSLLELSKASFKPAGLIILLTGAGGVFKQMLIDTGAGNDLALYFTKWGLPILILAFLLAALVRIVKGSATVAMITAASLVAPLMGLHGDGFTALIVIAIASGASIFSHVNDSGFWLVSNYLGMDEKQTFASWTIMTTLLAFCGLICVLVLSLFFS